jgi:choice-of-anchor A domain-containing protein
MQNTANHWNVITSGDVQLTNSDFEGRAYIAGSIDLFNFHMGDKLNLQCVDEVILFAGRLSANQGNFCGGRVATNNAARVERVGNVAACNGRNCGPLKVIPHPGINPWPEVMGMANFLNHARETGACRVEGNRLKCKSNEPNSHFQLFKLNGWGGIGIVEGIEGAPGGNR